MLTAEDQIKFNLDKLVDEFKNSNPTTQDLSVQMGIITSENPFSWYPYAQVNIKVYDKVLCFKRRYQTHVSSPYAKLIIDGLTKEFKLFLGYVQEYSAMPFDRLPLQLGLSGIEPIYQEFVKSIISIRLEYGA